MQDVTDQPNRDKALHWLKKAAELSFRLFDFEKSRHYYRHALACTVPDTIEYFDVLKRFAIVSMKLGQYSNALAHLEKMESQPPPAEACSLRPLNTAAFRRG
jgi:tetratricopeptide (TPR) repeat protein